MTLAYGADRLESARLVLRRIAADDYARDVLRLTYAISAILPRNARSRRVAERTGARAVGHMEVSGLTWDCYEWPLAPGGDTPLQPRP